MRFYKNDVDMLRGPITPGLLKIAIPVMVMNVVQSLFNIIDMTILKSNDADGGFSVGAVGVCGTLITLISGLLIGVATGANVIIARHIGSGDNERRDRAVGTSVLFSLIGGLTLTVIGVSCAELFLSWTNCPDELLDGAVLYFRLYFLGVPILMVYNFAAAIMRATGDSTRPMIFLTLGGAAKILFSYLLVAVLNMGIPGVAIATIISWSFSTILALIALMKRGGEVRIKPKYLRLYKKELSDVLYIGIPAGLQSALYSIANVIITATVNSFGPEATTGISIANNFDGILYNVSTATAIAVMPYVSQNIGNKNVRRATQSVTRGIIVTVALGAIFGMLSAVFSAQLSSIMSDDPTVIAYSQQKMIIISSTYFICGINDIFGGALRGMGRPIVSTVATLVFMCAIRFVWVYAIFPLYENLTFLYLIWPIGWVLSIVTLLFFYFPTVNRYRERFAKGVAPNEN